MIYQYRPLESEEIVIAADPAEGHDYSAWIALSKKRADVVMCGRAKEESSQLGYTLNHVGKHIKTRTGYFPTIAVERNTGSATLYVLKQLNYPSLYRMPSSFTQAYEETTIQYGWVTSSATRPKMLDDLALAVRTHAITIPSKQIVDEMFSFIRHEKTGKAQSEVGSHDDFVIALAIVWQLYQTVPTSQVYIPPENSTANRNWSLSDNYSPKPRVLNFKIGS